MNLNVVAPINRLSYGYVSAQLCAQLAKHLNISIHPIGAYQPDPNIQIPLGYPHSTVVPGPSLRIYHQFDLALHVGLPRIGMPIFELNQLRPIEINHMGAQDILISCSHWAKSICDAYSLPSAVVPLGVDRATFNEGLCSNPNRPFTFFNGGKWEIRKGHDLLLEAFNNAFSKRDDVRLELLCQSPFPHHAQYNEDWYKRFKQSKNGDKISILGRVDTLSDVASIMANTDCGVFPARAEGWNLELLEMLSMGKPCIAGNYSAPTEYLSDKNCYLLQPKRMVPASDGVWFGGFGEWADYSVDDLVDLMRAAFKAGPKLNQEGIETAKKFTWEESCAKLIKAIS